MRCSFVLAVSAVFALACTGPRGYTGPQGPTGMTGERGPTGMTGAQGLRGTTESRGQRPPVGGWVTLRDILFDFDEADFRRSETNKISDIASYVDQNPSVRLRLDDSPDLIHGTNQRNVDLGQRRVANVRDALMRAGVPAERIETGDFAERAACHDSAEQCSGRVEVLARTDR